MNNKVDLTTDEVIVLQQIHQDGEDDVYSLAQLTGIPRNYLMKILTSLKHKGLVVLNSTYEDIWARVTIKGRRLVRVIWPEAVLG